MNQNNLIDEMLKELSHWLPAGTADIRQDLEKNLRQVMQQGLDKMGLVTREEFEVQRGVLLRTRAKIEAMEKQLADLEQRLSQ